MEEVQKIEEFKEDRVIEVKQTHEIKWISFKYSKRTRQNDAYFDRL